MGAEQTATLPAAVSLLHEKKRLQNAKVLELGKLLVRTSFVSQPTSFTGGVGTLSFTHSNCVHSRAQVSALIVQFSGIK